MSSWPYVRSIASIALCLFCIFSVTCPARAEDRYYSGEPKLQVEGNRSVTLIKTTVRIENFNVNVKHAFKSQSRQRIDLTFTLNAPSFGNRGDDAPYPDRSFSDLIMSLDGKRVPYTTNSKAYLNNKDVTQILADVSLSPNDVGKFGISPETASPASGTVHAKLKDSGLIDSKGRPLWSAKNDYEFKMDMPPRSTAVFQYVYNGLPGIFYISPEDVDRPEISRLVGIPWNSLQGVFGDNTRIQGFNILRVMNLPFWADSWRQPAEQLEINISMSAVGDRQCLLVLLLDGQVYSGEGRLHLRLSKYQVKGPAWLAVYSPFSVH